MATASALYRKLTYNPLTDFEYVSQVIDVPMTLVGRKDLPAKDFNELLAYLKAKARRSTSRNAGLGAVSHLCGMLFRQAIGVELTTVPYQGTGPAMNALLGGQVDLLCDQTTSTTQYIKAGTVKLYGVTTAARLKTLPDAPTLAEQGLKDFEVVVWHGVYAPKGTPKEAHRQVRRSTEGGAEGSGRRPAPRRTGRRRSCRKPSSRLRADADVHGVEAGDHGVQGNGSDEAQVQRSRNGRVRLGLELAALNVRVHLLASESERLSLHGWRAADERFQPHAQDFGVEADAFRLAVGRQNEMVEMVDHCIPLLRGLAAGIGCLVGPRSGSPNDMAMHSSSQRSECAHAARNDVALRVRSLGLAEAHRLPAAAHTRRGGERPRAALLQEGNVDVDRSHVGPIAGAAARRVGHRAVEQRHDGAGIAPWIAHSGLKPISASIVFSRSNCAVGHRHGKPRRSSRCGCKSNSSSCAGSRRSCRLRKGRVQARGDRRVEVLRRDESDRRLDDEVVAQLFHRRHLLATFQALLGEVASRRTLPPGHRAEAGVAVDVEVVADQRLERLAAALERDHVELAPADFASRSA